jgi:hypothetical protein
LEARDDECATFGLCEELEKVVCDGAQDELLVRILYPQSMGLTKGKIVTPNAVLSRRRAAAVGCYEEVVRRSA